MTNKKITRLLSLVLSFCLLFEQTGFAQVAGQINLSGYMDQLRTSLTQDKFRPLHLRYLSYDPALNNFQVLLDKGALKNKQAKDIESSTETLLKYFLVGVSLPNESFWVNLRPDSPDNVIDDYLARTDVGKVLLETDLQLKKDTARFTSPETPEGREYWDKLYKKAGEMFSSENISIPTLTRPWIVPAEIIIRETDSNAYIYKATLKVMLEEDYLKDSSTYNFEDERLKELNAYSSELIRQLIIPKITQEVNTAKRYAPLRQVYYSLVLAQWFKNRFYGKSGTYSYLIDKKDLNGLTSKEDWSKNTYFEAYQKSFKDGEYNLKEPAYTPGGQTIRSYFSGGIAITNQSMAEAMRIGAQVQPALTKAELPKELLKMPFITAQGGTLENPADLKITINANAVQAPGILGGATGAAGYQGAQRDIDDAVAKTLDAWKGLPLADNCVGLASLFASNMNIAGEPALIIGNASLRQRPSLAWEEASGKAYREHYLGYIKHGDRHIAVDLTEPDVATGARAKIFAAPSLDALRTALSAHYGGIEDNWKIEAADADTAATQLRRAKALLPARQTSAGEETPGIVGGATGEVGGQDAQSPEGKQAGKTPYKGYESALPNWKLFVRLYASKYGITKEEFMRQLNGKRIMLVGPDTDELPNQLAQQLDKSTIIAVNPLFKTKIEGNIYFIGDTIQNISNYPAGKVDFIFSSGLFNPEYTDSIRGYVKPFGANFVYAPMFKAMKNVLAEDGQIIIIAGNWGNDLLREPAELSGLAEENINNESLPIYRFTHPEREQQATGILGGATGAQDIQPSSATSEPSPALKELIEKIKSGENIQWKQMRQTQEGRNLIKEVLIWFVAQLGKSHPVELVTTDFTEEKGVLGGKRLGSLYRAYENEKDRNGKNILAYMLDDLGIEITKEAIIERVKKAEVVSWEPIVASEPGRRALKEFLFWLTAQVGKSHPAALKQEDFNQNISALNEKRLGGFYDTYFNDANRGNKGTLIYMLDNLGIEITKEAIIEIFKGKERVDWGALRQSVSGRRAIRDLLFWCAAQFGKSHPAEFTSQEFSKIKIEALGGISLGGLYNFYMLDENRKGRDVMAYLFDDLGIEITKEVIIEKIKTGGSVNWDLYRNSESGKRALKEFLFWYSSQIGKSQTTELIADDFNNNIDALSRKAITGLYQAYHNDANRGDKDTLIYMFDELGIVMTKEVIIEKIKTGDPVNWKLYRTSESGKSALKEFLFWFAAQVGKSHPAALKQEDFNQNISALKGKKSNGLFDAYRKDESRGGKDTFACMFDDLGIEITKEAITERIKTGELVNWKLYRTSKSGKSALKELLFWFAAQVGKSHPAELIADDFNNNIEALNANTLSGLYANYSHDKNRNDKNVLSYMLEDLGITLEGIESTRASTGAPAQPSAALKELIEKIKVGEQAPWKKIRSTEEGRALIKELLFWFTFQPEVNKSHPAALTSLDLNKKISSLNGNTLLRLYQHYSIDENRKDKNIISCILDDLGIEVTKEIIIEIEKREDRIEWDTIRESDSGRRALREFLFWLITQPEINKFHPVALTQPDFKIKISALNGKTLSGLCANYHKLIKNSKLKRNVIAYMLNDLGIEITKDALIEKIKARAFVKWRALRESDSGRRALRDLLFWFASQPEINKSHPSGLVTADFQIKIAALNDFSLNGFYSNYATDTRRADKNVFAYMFDDLGVEITKEGIIERLKGNNKIEWAAVKQSKSGKRALRDLLFWFASQPEINKFHPAALTADDFNNIEVLNANTLSGLYANYSHDKNRNDKNVLSYMLEDLGIEVTKDVIIERLKANQRFEWDTFRQSSSGRRALRDLLFWLASQPEVNKSHPAALTGEDFAKKISALNDSSLGLYQHYANDENRNGKNVLAYMLDELGIEITKEAIIEIVKRKEGADWVMFKQSDSGRRAVREFLFWLASQPEINKPHPLALIAHDFNKKISALNGATSGGLYNNYKSSLGAPGIVGGATGSTGAQDIQPSSAPSEPSLALKELIEKIKARERVKWQEIRSTEQGRTLLKELLFWFVSQPEVNKSHPAELTQDNFQTVISALNGTALGGLHASYSKDNNRKDKNVLSYMLDDLGIEITKEAIIEKLKGKEHVDWYVFKQSASGKRALRDLLFWFVSQPEVNKSHPVALVARDFSISIAALNGIALRGLYGNYSSYENRDNKNILSYMLDDLGIEITKEAIIERLKGKELVDWDVFKQSASGKRALRDLLFWLASQPEINKSHPAELTQDNFKTAISALNGNALSGLYGNYFSDENRGNKNLISYMLDDLGIEFTKEAIIERLKGKEGANWQLLRDSASGKRALREFLFWLISQPEINKSHPAELTVYDFNAKISALNGNTLRGLYGNYSSDEKRDNKNILFYMLDDLGIEFTKEAIIERLKGKELVDWDVFKQSASGKRALREFLFWLASQPEINKSHPAELTVVNLSISIAALNGTALGGLHASYSKDNNRKDKDFLSYMLDDLGIEITKEAIIERLKGKELVDWDVFKQSASGKRALRDLLFWLASQPEVNKSHPAELTVVNLSISIAALNGNTLSGLYRNYSKDNNRKDKNVLAYMLDDLGIGITKEAIIERLKGKEGADWKLLRDSASGKRALREFLFWLASQPEINKSHPAELTVYDFKTKIAALNGTALGGLYYRYVIDENRKDISVLDFMLSELSIKGPGFILHSIADSIEIYLVEDPAKCTLPYKGRSILNDAQERRIFILDKAQLENESALKERITKLNKIADYAKEHGIEDILQWVKDHPKEAKEMSTQLGITLEGIEFTKEAIIERLKAKEDVDWKTFKQSAPGRRALREFLFWLISQPEINKSHPLALTPDDFTKEIAALNGNALSGLYRNYRSSLDTPGIVGGATGAAGKGENSDNKNILPYMFDDLGLRGPGFILHSIADSIEIYLVEDPAKCTLPYKGRSILNDAQERRIFILDKAQLENESALKERITKVKQIIGFARGQNIGDMAQWAKYNPEKAQQLWEKLGIASEINGADKEDAPQVPSKPAEDATTIVRKKSKELFDSLRRLTYGDFSMFAARYSKDIKNIIWGMVSEELKGGYDREKIEKLVESNVMEEIFEKSPSELKPAGRSGDSPAESPAPRVFEGENLSQQDINGMASFLDKKISEITNEGIKEITRRQAANFIRKLEENYYFKTYYKEDPDMSATEEAAQAVKRAIDTAEAKNSDLLKLALQDLLGEIEEAVLIQKKLHETGRGLRPTTNLNLYQAVAVSRMLREKKVILGDEMGLGKTLETIATFLLSEENEMLVIGPKAALSRWVEDLVKHTDTDIELAVLADDPAITESLPESSQKIKLVKLRSPKERYEYLLLPRGPPAAKRIMLINYESIPFLSRHISRTGSSLPKFGFLALDEAHMLKNRGAQRTGTIFGNGKDSSGIDANYKVIITGTPLENEPSDLLGYLKYLARGGESESEKLFAQIDPKRFSKAFSKIEIHRLSLLHNYLNERMIRRLKENVVTGLPAKEYRLVKVNPLTSTMDIPGEKEVALSGDYHRQIDMYEMALHDPAVFEKRFTGTKGMQKNEDDEEIDEEAAEVITRQITRLEQSSLDPGIFSEEGDSIKYDAAKVLLDERLGQGKSVLIFTNYRTAARNFKEYLIRKGYPVDKIAYIDGTVTGRERKEQERKFQNKEAQILVATTGTMGVAVELTQADSVFFLNYPWKPSTLNQAIDRAHRRDSKRNYEGKKLEIICFEIDMPLSIDKLKADTLRSKSILGEMVVEGNLTQGVLDAFYESETKISQEIDERTESAVSLNDYELSLLSQFRLKIGAILQVKDPIQANALWNEVAELYSRILEHKGSFFANMASLDYLGGEMFPEFKERGLVALDLASGPSTMYRAYGKKQGQLSRKGFRISRLVDYDLSPMMLKAGVQRLGDQFVGPLDRIGEAFAENTFDIVNISYAFRYTGHPAKLIRDVHRVLKEGGVFVMILPPADVIPERFFSALKEAGFDLKVGRGAKLQARIDKETYSQLVYEFGKEFANDLVKHAEAEFTYLVANKKRPLSGELQDKDFDIARKVPPLNADKVERLRSTEARNPLVLPGVSVEGKVRYVSDPGDTFVKKELKRIAHKISIISKIAEQYSSIKGNDEKLARKRGGLGRELRRKQGELVRLVKNSSAALDRSEKQTVISKLIELEERRLTRRWFEENSEFINEAMSILRAKSSTDQAPGIIGGATGAVGKEPVPGPYEGLIQANAGALLSKEYGKAANVESMGPKGDRGRVQVIVNGLVDNRGWILPIGFGNDVEVIIPDLNKKLENGEYFTFLIRDKLRGPERFELFSWGGNAPPPWIQQLLLSSVSAANKMDDIARAGTKPSAGQGFSIEGWARGAVGGTGEYAEAAAKNNNKQEPLKTGTLKIGPDDVLKDVWKKESLEADDIKFAADVDYDLEQKIRKAIAGRVNSIKARVIEAEKKSLEEQGQMHITYIFRDEIEAMRQTIFEEFFGKQYTVDNAGRLMKIRRAILGAIEDSLKYILIIEAENKIVSDYQNSCRILVSNHPLVKELQDYVDKMSEPGQARSRLVVAIDGKNPSAISVGHTILINLSLIAKLDTRDEVAAALAHEQGHQEKNKDYSRPETDFSKRMDEYASDLVSPGKLKKLGFNTQALGGVLRKIVGEHAQQDIVHGNVSDRILAEEILRQKVDFETGPGKGNLNSPIPDSWWSANINSNILDRLISSEYDSDFESAVQQASPGILNQAKEVFLSSLRGVSESNKVYFIYLRKLIFLMRNFNASVEKLAKQNQWSPEQKVLALLAALMSGEEDVRDGWLDFIFNQRAIDYRPSKIGTAGWQETIDEAQKMEELFKSAALSVLSSIQKDPGFLDRLEEKNIQQLSGGIEKSEMADFLSIVLSENEAILKSASLDGPQNLKAAGDLIWKLENLKPERSRKFSARLAKIIYYSVRDFWNNKGQADQDNLTELIKLLKEVNKYYGAALNLSAKQIEEIYKVEIYNEEDEVKKCLWELIERQLKIGYDKLIEMLLEMPNAILEECIRIFQQKDEKALVKFIDKPANLDFLTPRLKEWRLDEDGKEIDPLRDVFEKDSSLAAWISAVITKHWQNLAFSKDQSGEMERIQKFCSTLEVIIYLPVSKWQERLEAIVELIRSPEAKELYNSIDASYFGGIIVLLGESLKYNIKNKSEFSAHIEAIKNLFLNTEFFKTLSKRAVTFLAKDEKISSAKALFESIVTQSSALFAEFTPVDIFGKTESHRAWLLPICQKYFEYLQNKGTWILARLNEAQEGKKIDSNVILEATNYYFALEEALPASQHKQQALLSYTKLLIDRLPEEDLSGFLRDLANMARRKEIHISKEIYDYFVEKRVNTVSNYKYFKSKNEEALDKIIYSNYPVLDDLLVGIDNILDESIKENSALSIFEAMLASNKDDEKLREILVGPWFNVSLAAESSEEYKIIVKGGKIEIEGLNKHRFIPFNAFIRGLFDVPETVKIMFMEKLLLSPNGILHDQAAKIKFADIVARNLPKKGNFSELITNVLHASVDTLDAVDVFSVFLQPLSRMFLQKPQKSGLAAISKPSEKLKDAISKKPYDYFYSRFINLSAEAIEDFLRIDSRFPFSASGIQETESLVNSFYGRWEETFNLTPDVNQAKSTSSDYSDLDQLSIIIDACQRLGPVGVRFLQVLGQYLPIPEEHQERFRDVYDSAKGQDKVTAFNTLLKAAEEYPEVKKFLDEDLVSIDKKIGGGSIVTVFSITVRNRDGQQKLTSGTHKEVLKIRNPNAESKVRDATEAARGINDWLNERQAYSVNNYMIVKHMIEDISDWISKDIRDDKYLDLDAKYSAVHGDYLASNGMRVKVSATLLPYNKDVKREAFVSGLTLNKILKLKISGKPLDKLTQEENDPGVRIFLENLEKRGISLDDILKKGTEAVIEHFARCMKEPAFKNEEGNIYLFHSDIHFGNAIISEDLDTVYLIDRNFYQQLKENDVAFLRSIISTDTKNGLGVLNRLLDYFSSLPEYKGSINNRTFSGKLLKALVAIWIGIKIKLLRNANQTEIFMKIIQELEKRNFKIPLQMRIMFKNLMSINVMLRTVGERDFSSFAREQFNNPLKPPASQTPGIIGGVTGTVGEQDVQSPAPQEEAVKKIREHFDVGEDRGKLTIGKLVADGAMFTSTPTATLLSIAKHFLTGKERVLDLGSGTGRAVAVFSQFARFVRGIEKDRALHEEAVRDFEDLIKKNVDLSNADLTNADFLDESVNYGDFDLLYIFWPSYDLSLSPAIKEKLEKKILRELKPGAKLVIRTLGSDIEFKKIKFRKVELKAEGGSSLSDLAVPEFIMVYEKPIEGVGSSQQQAPGLMGGANGLVPAGAQDKTGGIDFRALPIITQPAPLGIVPLVRPERPLMGTVPVSKLDTEWSQIENMVEGGIIPSTDRLKEYLENCNGRDCFDKDMGKVLACIADILRLEEERCCLTEDSLKELLVLLESDKPADGFTVSLAKIRVLPQEPVTIDAFVVEEK